MPISMDNDQPSGPVELMPDEIVAGRLFSHPTENETDLEILAYMLEKLRAVLRQPNQQAGPTRPVKIDLTDADDSRHRIVIIDWAALLACETLTAVGFFGQAKLDIDHTPILDLENALIEQLADFPGLLSYYNLYLPGKGWGNLIFCSDSAVKAQWRTNPTHIRAATEFTPRHYYSVRLHNGRLSGGILSDQPLVLLRTKYFDYRDQTLWHAVRVYERV